MTSHTQGEGDLPKGDVVPKAFCTMCDKGKGGVKNLKIWVMSFMDRPFGSEKIKKHKKKNLT